MRKKKNRCRDDWYAHDDEVACGFKYENGERVFDSQVNSQLFCEVFTHTALQGFCCGCTIGGSTFYRGSDIGCKIDGVGVGGSTVGHCLRFSPL